MNHINFDPKGFLRDRQDRNTNSGFPALLHDKSSFYARKYVGFELAEQKILEPKAEPKNITFQSFDTTYIVPGGLFDIVDELKDSSYIANLENDWDGHQAEKIGQEIYSATVSFLINYSNYIYENYDIIIDAPEINPVPNGSVDLSWRTKQARMLVNIKKKDNNIIGTFYGYHTSDKLPIEGFIDIEKVKKSTAIWMSELR